MSLIPNKSEFYKLYQAHMLGNGTIQFDTWIAARDWAEASPERTIGVRQRVADGKFTPHVRPQDLLKLITYMYHVEKIRCDQLHFSAMMPDHEVLLRGYVSRGTCDEAPWTLEYSEEKHTSMQEVMKRPTHMTGLKVYWKLKGMMDNSSWENLLYLLDKYPDSIVEFGIYPYCVGTEGWNTIFWEVRHY